MKRFLAMFLCVCLAAASMPMLALGEAAEETRVVIGCPDTSTLTPWVNPSGGRQITIYSVYEYLLARESATSGYVYWLMESMEQKDTRVFDVKIYDYIYDHAGNHLTAADVVFCFESAIAGGNINSLNGMFESIVALGDYTVEFVLQNDPTYNSLEEAFAYTPIVTRVAFEASGDEMAVNAVSTSAYRVSSFVSGSSLTLEKTDSYWQTDEGKRHALSRANVDIIDFKSISDSTQLSIALETGSIDLAYGLSMEDIAPFMEGGSASDRFYTTKVPTNTRLLSFNCDDEAITSDLNLRKAIMYCFDASAMCAAIGEATYRVYGLGSPTNDGYDPSWEAQGYFEYDPDAAQQYLKAYMQEHGIASPSDITIRIISDKQTLMESLSTMLQGFIMALGMNCTFDAMESSVYNSVYQDPSNWEISLNGATPTGSLLDFWYKRLCASRYTWGGTMNFVFDDRLQELLTLCTSKEGYSQENINTLQSYLNENCYFMGLIGINTFYACANWITEIYTTPTLQPGACTYDWSLKQ